MSVYNVRRIFLNLKSDLKGRIYPFEATVCFLLIFKRRLKSEFAFFKSSLR